MSIASKLAEVAEIKEDLREAINEHFTTERLSVNDGLSSYAQAIDEITLTGPNLPTEPKAVNFIDYDGTLLYAYTAQEFQAMEGLPRNPWHSGLIAQGWNWTREEILDYLTRAERIDISQNYITDDGKTKLYMNIRGDLLLMTLTFQQTKTNGVLIDWGDRNTERCTGTNITVTHTYTQQGLYLITLLPDDDCNLELSTSPANTTVSYAQNGFIGQIRYHGYRFADLYKVEIGKNVTRIASNAFLRCVNLQTCTIPNEVTTFSNGCFDACRKLKFISISKNTEHIKAFSFYGCNSFKYVSIPPNQNLTTIEGSSFYACTNIPYILIPDNITHINGSVFFNCSALKTLYLSRNLAQLNSAAFRSCWRLLRISLPNTLTILGNGTQASNQQSYIFGGCWSLLTLEIPESVEYLPAYLCVDTMSMVTLILPSSLTTIENNSIKTLTTLRRLILRATVPPTLGTGNFTNTFGTIIGGTNSHGGKLTVLYVPYSEDHSILEAYKTATNWSALASYMTELNPDGTIPTE